MSHEEVDGQCQKCGLKVGDTDMLSLDTYICIPNDWRSHPCGSSVRRIYEILAEEHGYKLEDLL
jgi:hypothetical protein